MKKLTSKLLFDILLTAIWSILMIYSLSGSLLHELLGLGILGLFIIHIGYNLRLIRAEAPRMFRSGRRDITIRYILVLLLTSGIVVTGISGILISKDILTGIEAPNLVFWTALHHWTAYLTLILIGIHIGLHLKMIGSVITRPFREHPAVIAWLRRGWNVAAALLIVCGSIASFQYELPAFAKAGASPSDEATNSPDSDTLVETPDHPSNLMNIAHTYPTYEPAGSEDETLEEYLGSQICTICHRCCPLTALQCSRGQSALEQATQEYYANHNASSENGEIQNDDAPDNQTADNSDDPVSKPDLPDILSIMGLYVGGTYYVSQITDARRKRRSCYNE